MPSLSKRLYILLLALAPVSAPAATFSSSASACGRPGNAIANSPVPVSTSDFTSTCGNLFGVVGEASGSAGVNGINGFVNMLAWERLENGSSYQGRVTFAATFRNATNTPGTALVRLILNQENTFADPLPGTHFAQVEAQVLINSQGFQTVAKGAPNVGGAFGLTQITLGGGPQTLTTDAASVNLNESTGVFYNYAVSAVSSQSFLAIEQMMVNGRLSFNRSGPVFDLPVGITVDDIPELYIFNNRFTPPGEAVPEPATLTLLGAGLVGAALLRRRR